jgi:hypothetical protein
MKAKTSSCLWSRAGLRALAGLLLIAAPSCRLLQGAVEAPGKLLEPSHDDHVSAAAVQSDVMRFTDRFDSAIVQSTHDFAALAGTPAAHIQSLKWSISARTAALTIASGPNPNSGLLDMLVFVTLERMVHEELWLPDVWGAADQPMLDAYKDLEAQIWEIAGHALKPAQLDEIHALIDAWRKDNPAQASTALVRLPHFEHLLTSRREKDPNVFEDLGKLFSMDPLAGLEPAKREIAATRMLGERVLYYLQRAPLVFSAQAELLSLETANLPEVQEALKRGAQISDAAVVLAQTAANLPETLLTVEAPVEQMLVETRKTLDAAKETSAVVQDAVQTLDTFIARQKTDPSTGQDPGKPGHPFDVREYGEAATRIGEAATKLDGFLTRVDRSEVQVQQLLDDVQQRGDRSLDRASRRFLVVGLVLIGAGAGAALLVLWIARRGTRRRRKSSVGEAPISPRIPREERGLPAVHAVER